MEFSPDVCLEDLCPVCGDQVSGYHYGLLTCESCKGFFKRTVQNNKTYVCVEYQECRIDKTQRKRCPFCRFQKCLQVGMRLEAVRADRMRGGRNKFGPMYKRDRALKQQRRALIQGGGFGTESAPPLLSLNPYRDWTFTGDLHPVPILHSTPLLTAQNECLSLQPPSLSSLLPPISPAAPQLHSTPSSNWTIKSEPTSSTSPSASSELFSDQLYPLPLSPPCPQSPPLELELLRGGPDELYLQEKISARLLQEQASWGGHWTPTTFSLMCVMADQTLLGIVEWARTSIFFKQLKVSDQMKLLHSCWSDLLLLDVVCRQVLFGGEGRLLLVTGEEIDLLDVASHAGPTLYGLVHRGQELVQRLQVLKVDHQEFTCMKFLILFNPEVKQLEEHRVIESVQEQVKGALLEYTLSTSSHLLGRFSHLLQCVSELRSLSTLAEDYLYDTHLSGEPPCDNLLLEMLHAKHRRT